MIEEGEKKLHTKKQKVSKTLKREEIPEALIKSIYSKFTSPVIDLKKDYVRTNDNRVYTAQTKADGKSISYELVIEERYADIVAIVEVIETIIDL